jgi:hypothetical protein
MPTDKQIDWLRSVNAKAVESYDQMMLRRARDARTQQLQVAVDERTRRLREDLAIRMRGGRGDDKQLLSYGRRDQTLEFDTDDLQDGYVLDEGDVERYMDAQRVLGELLPLMDDQASWPEVDGNGDPVLEPVLDEQGEPVMSGGSPVMRQKMKSGPLFSDKQKGAELYHPLVRQGLLPENFVPDQYSETREMSTESFQLYKAEIEQAPPTAPWKKVLSIASKVVSVVTPFVSIARLPAGSEVSGSIAAAVKTENLSLSVSSSLPVVESMVAMGMDVLNLGVNVVEDVTGGGKGPGAGAPTPPGTVFTLMGQQLCADISTRFGPIEVGMMVSSTYTATLDRAAILTLLIKREGGWFEAIADKLADALAVAAARCDAGDGALTGAGQAAKLALAGALKGTAKAGLEAALGVEDEDLPGFLKRLSAAAGPALDGHLSQQQLQDLEANKGTIQEKVNAFRQSDLLQQQSEEDKRREEELAELQNAEDARAVASLLARKIARYQRHRKTIDYVKKTSTLSMSVAAAIFGPLAIAGSLEQLVLKAAAAAKATDELAAAVSARRDMLIAASAFAAPLKSFISESDAQRVQHEIAACLEFINLAGAVNEAVGLGTAFAPAVAAGKILQSAAAGAAAIQTVVLELNKVHKVEKAWAFYRAALMRPDNRVLALKAMEKNPALAKWALAWGAVIKKDVLVKDYMAHFKLTAEELKDPRVDVGELKQWLELKRGDDVDVGSRKGLATGWEPSDYALTVKNWTDTQFAAERKAKLLKTDPSRIIAGFARLELAEEALSESQRSYESVEEAFQEALREHRQALTGGDDQATQRTLERAQRRHERLGRRVELVARRVEESRAALVDTVKALNQYRPETRGQKGVIIHAPMRRVQQRFLAELSSRQKAVNSWSRPELPARP